MLSARDRGPAKWLLAFAALWGALGVADAQDAPGPGIGGRATQPRSQALRVPSVPEDHPLLGALKDAREWLAYVRRTVRDSHCRIVKRERIDGILQDYYYINAWVREEVREGERVTTPLSVYMEFLGPSHLAGRRLLFVEGKNEGKILVRKGGERFEYVVTKIDPNSDSTRSESLYPITQTGFVAALTDLVATLERHLAADPSGENTIVERPQGGKVDGRTCQVMRITHPRRQSGLEFHVDTVFLDSELRVPVRIEKLDWPSRPDAEPPLIGEYNHTKVQLNVGLTDQMFDPRRLRAKR